MKLIHLLKLKIVVILCLAYFIPVYAHPAANVVDSLALVNFYNSTNGANWTNHNNWLVGTLNTWHGVVLNSTGKVENLLLSSNNIEGTLPDFNLSALKKLDLQGNKLSGSIPNFSQMPLLADLRLNPSQSSTIKLSGVIPNFVNCTMLKILVLRDNALTGSIPNFINCTQLDWLDVRTNQLSGSLPSILPTTLRVFYTDNNSISGNLPNYNLPILRELRVSNNDLYGELPLLENCDSLTYLYVDYNNFSGALPNYEKPILAQIWAHFNNLNTIPSLSNCPKLYDMTLYFNQLESISWVPNTSGTAYPVKVRLGYNKLDFEDLEPYQTQIFLSPSHQYEGQTPILPPSTSVGVTGPINFDAGIGGINTTYQWRKNGVNIPNSNSRIYNIPAPSNADIGAYTCYITHPNFPLLNFTSNPHYISLTPPIADSLALVNFYNSTNGANWTNHNNWLVGTLNTWYGLVLNSAGKVESLLLSSNNIEGTLPDFNLSALKKLDLQGNKLSGGIPNFSQMPLLEELYLNPTQGSPIKLSGAIPDFANCTMLKILVLRDNALTGSIPNFSNCTQLDWLDVRTNQLSGSLPSTLPTTLRVFYTDNNNISGNLPNYNLPILRELRVSNNDLYGELPLLENCDSLTHLYVDYNNFSGALPNYEKPILAQIWAHFNNLNTIPSLSNCPKLYDMTLYYNQLESISWVPNTSGTAYPVKVRLGYNKLDFEDLEPYQTQIFLSPNHQYEGQTPILSSISTDTLSIGTNYIFDAGIGGINTLYQWQKNGVDIVGETTRMLNIYAATVSNLGTYTCHITNPIFPLLTFTSSPHYIVQNAVHYYIDQRPTAPPSYFDSFAAVITFLSSITQLNNPIIFEIIPGSGPYCESFILPDVPGSNPTNSITFLGNGEQIGGAGCPDGLQRPMSGSAELLTPNAIVQINGGDNYVLESLNITAQNDDNCQGWGIHLTNGSDFVQIKGCTIDVGSSNTDDCYIGIVASASENSIAFDVGLGNNANNTIINENTIKGGYANIVILGKSDTSMLGPSVQNNILEDGYRYGVETVFLRNSRIDKNNIDMMQARPNSNSSTQRSAISQKCVTSSLEGVGFGISITGNIIDDVARVGIELIDVYSNGGPTEEPIIANNIINTTLLDNSESTSGIYAYKLRKSKILHNTVNAEGVGNKSALLIKQSENVDIINNSFVFNGADGVAMRVDDSPNNIVSDYNNYYNPNGDEINYQGTLFADISEAALPYNDNSISVEPQFVYQIEGSSVMINKGNNSVANIVPNDFQSEVRPDPLSNLPDIGADEFWSPIYNNTANYNMITNFDALDYESTNANNYIGFYSNNILSDSIIISLSSPIPLGVVTPQLYRYSNCTVQSRFDAYGTAYLNRTIKLTSPNAIPANTPISILLFFTEQEFEELRKADPSVHTIDDLAITFYKGNTSNIDICTGSLSNALYIPASNIRGQSMSEGYTLKFILPNTTQLGSFWIHGKNNSQPIVGCTTCSDAVLYLSAYLEGACDGSSTMRTDLINNNLLPTAPPYNIESWNGNCIEGNSNYQLPLNAVDWVMVELKKGNDSISIARKIGLLLNNGQIISSDGTNGLQFKNLHSQSCYILLHQRNHLSVVSTNPILLTDSINYNFSIPTNVQGGIQQLTQIGTLYGLKAGDIDGNGSIELGDFIQYYSNGSIVKAYITSDTNLDGNTTYADFNLWKKNEGTIGMPMIR